MISALLHLQAEIKMPNSVPKNESFVIVAGQNRVLGLLRYSQIIKQCVPVLQSLNGTVANNHEW